MPTALSASVSARASSEIRFHSAASFTGGKVDADNAVISGVSVITGDCEAEGHDLHVDATTVAQLHARAGKKVPVNLDHGSGIKDTCGYLTNFHISGNKLRADWHLLKSHDETPKMLERAQVMPECFGLSVKFKGKGEKKGVGAAAKKFARCEKLISVDCVTQPAANEGGLFSVPSANEVDRGQRGMPKRTSTTQASDDSADTTLAELKQLILEQQETIADLGSQIADLQQPAPGDEAGEGAEGEMTDAEINALVQAGQVIIDQRSGEARWASPEAEAAYYGEGQGDEGAGDLAGAGAGAGNGGGDGSAVAAMAAGAMREIHQFRTELARNKKAAIAAEEEQAFARLDANIIALSEQNAELITELEAANAQIVALQRTVRLKAGGNPSPSRGSEILFRKGHAEEGSYESLVAAKFEELKAENPKLSALKAKSDAVTFCVKNHPDEYREYRERGGKIQLGK